MCKRPPSRDSGSMRSDSATWRGTVSRHDRSITVRDRSTAGIPRYSESASRISGSPNDPAASRREMNAAPPGLPSSAARRAASSRRPRETRTRPSCSIASPSATKDSYHGSGGEQIIPAFGVSPAPEIGPDLFACTRGAHRADHQRFPRWSQGGGRYDLAAAGDALVRRYVDEPPWPQAPGLQGTREPFSRRARSPDVEAPVAQGPASEVMGAKLDHPGASVHGPGAGEALRRIPPPEQHLRNLAELVSGLEEAQLEVPVLGPMHLAETAHRKGSGATEGHARVDERRLDEARRPALLFRDHRIQPAFEPREARGDRARETAHERPDRSQRWIAGERVRLQAQAVGMDQVVGVHPGDEVATAAAESELQRR